MAVKIQIRRGAKTNLPDLDEGELGFATDTKEVFIGTATAENVQILTGTAGVTQEAIVAQTLKTPRTITLSGDVTGSFTFDGSQALSVTTEVVNDSHTHDTRYYTETELNAGQLNNLYYTESELNAGQLDNRYYTETESNTLLSAKADLVSPVFTGTPTAPTAGTLTNNTQIATTAFVKDVLSTANASFSEWAFIEKINNATTPGTGDISIVRAFDIENFDYKFVVDLDTNAEDNSDPFIRLNNISTNSYNYVYERVSLTGASMPTTGASTSFGGHGLTNIGTGVLLGSASESVLLTNLRLEFSVSQSYGFGTFDSDLYSLFVHGNATALGTKAPVGTPAIFPIMSKFTGNLSTSEGFNRIDISHSITAGAIDSAVVRIYRRAK